MPTKSKKATRPDSTKTASGSGSKQQTLQPSISSFFASPNSNLSPSKPQKRPRSTEPSCSPLKRTQHDSPPIEICSSSPVSKSPTFAIPALPKSCNTPRESTQTDLTLADHDGLEHQLEEFVRPPELNEGQDDDDWDTLSESGSSVWMRGQEDEHEESQGGGPMLRCPICASSLDNMTLSAAEIHVNNCLDQPSQAPGLLACSSSSKLRTKPAPKSAPKPKPQASLKATPADAFGALMSAKAEQQAWAASDAPAGPKQTPARGLSSAERARSVPFYKLIEGTSLAVDAFKYGKIPRVTAYFLSHAHADHYTNLSGSWAHGLVYCSRTTANLIMHNLGVKKEWVRALEEDRAHLIDGVRVTLIDANHCPGSSLFVFEGISQPGGKPFTYLHCGDFRASPVHLRHPALRNKTLDIIYLDTTYLNPKYCFPAQEQVIQACAELVKARVVGADRGVLEARTREGKWDKQLAGSRAMLAGWLSGPAGETRSAGAATEGPTVAAAQGTAEKSGPKMARIFELAKGTVPAQESILVLVGTYTIGKERIVKEIAKAIRSKVYCDRRKTRIFGCIEDPELHGLLTDDPFKARVHVTNLFAIKRDSLEGYLDRFKGHFTHIIGIRPTGWTYRPDQTANPHPTVTQVLEMFGNKDQQSSGGVDQSGSLVFPQRDSTEKCLVVGVPYSEHSSFYELTCFCVSSEWKKIIPTVNCGNPSSRAKMKIWIDRWKLERNKRVAAATASSSSSLTGATLLESAALEKQSGDPVGFVIPRHEKYW